MRRILWFITFVLACIGMSEAATYHVAKTGSDSVSCGNADFTPDNTQAKLTISGASGGVSCLSAGDTLIIHVGTYTEQILGGNNVTIPPGTGESTRTVIQGAVGETVTIRPNSIVNDTIIGPDTSINDQYITFANLIVDGVNVIGGVEVKGAGVWGSAHHIRFSNLEIVNVFEGITLFNGAGGTIHDNEVLGGSIHDYGTFRGGLGNIGHGIYVTGDDNIIDGVHIYNGNCFGVHVYSDSPELPSGNIVRNNRVHDNGQNCYVASGGILIGTSADNIAYNNLSYNHTTQSGDAGIIIGYGASPSNNQAYNNSVYNNNVGIEIRSGSSNALVRNNIFYLNTDNVISSSGSTTFSNNLCNNADTGCNVTNEDPEFVSLTPGSEDFHLSSTASPAYNAGYDLSGVFTTDLEGTARPQAGTYDIGAYEFVQADVTPPDCTGDTLTLTVNSSSQITLDWTACTDANLTGYKIYRCLDAQGDSNCDPTGSLIQQTSGAGVTYPNTGLAASTQYGYQVYATDGPNDTVIPGGVKYATTPAAPAPTLIAQYGFETGTNPPQDTSGNGLHANAGTTVGTTYVPGKLGTYALHCNGTSSVVTIDDHNLLDLSTAFTLMMWVRPGALQTGYTSLLVKDATYAYYLYSTHGDATPVNVPAGGYYEGATTYREAWDASVLPASVWTHLALTWDGVSLLWYRDGVPGTPVPATGTITPTTGVLTLCARPPTTAEYFNGDVDDVRIYNGALSEATIDSIIAEAADSLAPAAPTNLRVIP